jgi:hypothetical protein
MAIAPGKNVTVAAPGPNTELNVHPQIGPGEPLEIVPTQVAKQSVNRSAGMHAGGDAGRIHSW